MCVTAADGSSGETTACTIFDRRITRQEVQPEQRNDIRLQVTLQLA